MNKTTAILIATVTFILLSLSVAKIIENKHYEFIEQQLADRTLDMYCDGVYVRAYDSRRKKEILIKDPACDIAEMIKQQ